MNPTKNSSFSPGDTRHYTDCFAEECLRFSRSVHTIATNILSIYFLSNINKQR
jgi:hypothetical protein